MASPGGARLTVGYSITEPYTPFAPVKAVLWSWPIGVLAEERKLCRRPSVCPDFVHYQPYRVLSKKLIR